MNILILALDIITIAGILQVPLAFAVVLPGYAENPYDHDSGPTKDPHDPAETGTSHDACDFHQIAYL
jgi:hypothetical protein